jgi:hypothetical protein
MEIPVEEDTPVHLDVRTIVAKTDVGDSLG